MFVLNVLVISVSYANVLLTNFHAHRLSISYFSCGVVNDGARARVQLEKEKGK